MHTGTNKLLIFSKQAARYRELIAAAGLPHLQIAATDDLAEAGRHAREANVWLGEPDRIRRLLPQASALAWVQSTWAGVEPLLDPAVRRDYVLTGVKDVFGPLIAEYVMCYALMHVRRGWQRYESQKRRRWDAAVPGTLRGKVMGIAGVGSIGARIAEAAKHFGMRTFGYTRRSTGCPHIDAYFHGEQLHAFAARLDYLVCVLPNTAESRHLIDAAVLAALPDQAVLINAGRGETVDEAALVAALQRGEIAAAVLDVFQTEPLPEDHPLWETPNVIVTAHTAGVSYPEDIAPIFIENYRRFAAGRPLHSVIDFERGY